MLSYAELERFFKLERPSNTDQSLFALSHFHNRLRAATFANSFDVIMNKPDKGQLILGQIPIRAFSAVLLRRLGPKGLVVSCNEYFEMAGNGTVYDVVKPQSWEGACIEHHHLPFTDYTENAQPSFVVETLKKMKTIYDEGGSIYVHCKAGSGRSPFVIILFHFLIEHEQYLDENPSSEDIDGLLEISFQHVKKCRPQITFNSNMKNLAIEVIRDYRQGLIESLKLPADNKHLPFLNTLVQSANFKALWHLAYTNKKLFADIKLVLEKLYVDTEKTLLILKGELPPPPKIKDNNEIEDVDKPLRTAIDSIKEQPHARQVLNKLLKNEPPSELQSAFTAFYTCINAAPYKHEPEIKKAAFQLVNEIFLSKLKDSSKAQYIRKTVDYLQNPEKSKDYINQALSAINVNQKIGKLMIGLSLAVLAATLAVALIYAPLMPIACIIFIVSPTVMFFGGYLATSSDKPIVLADIPVEEPSTAIAI